MKYLAKFLFLSFFLTGYFGFSQTQDDFEKHPLLKDKFIFTGGLFFPQKSLKLSVDGTVGIPQDVDIPVELPEDDIDFGENFDVSKHQTTFNIGFQWRFSKSQRWKLFADYFGVYNRWDAILDEPIEWEDVIYDVGADVRAGMDLGVVRAGVGYLLSRGNQHELGVGLGAHIMKMKIFIEGEATISNEDDEKTTEFQRGVVEATAPLPNIGAWYYWAPSPRWLLGADVDWLYIAIGDFQGGLWDVKGGVQFQVVDWFGVGANYRYYAIDLDVDKSDWRGSLNMSWSGPMVLLNFNF